MPFYDNIPIILQGKPGDQGSHFTTMWPWTHSFNTSLLSFIMYNRDDNNNTLPLSCENSVKLLYTVTTCHLIWAITVCIH